MFGIAQRLGVQIGQYHFGYVDEALGYKKRMKRFEDSLAGYLDHCVGRHTRQ